MANVPIQSSPDRNAKLRLLLVKLKHIGDALILTPTLVAIRETYPNAEIWVVVRKGTEGILAGCPAIDRLLTVAPVESDRRSLASRWRDIQTWRELRRQKFDYAFELTDGDRGRWLAGESRARARCVNVSFYRPNFWWRLRFNRFSETEWTEGHRVEKDYAAVSDFLPLKGEIPPLCFEQPKTRDPGIVDGVDDFAVLHPGTRWIKKRWPKEHWLSLGHSLLKRVKKIVVSCGPDDEERALAAELIEAWGADRAVSADGRLDWSDLAGLLHRARIFVGVDTAAMHLAAACQCPIVAFFAYSVVSQWRPWRAPCELIHPGHQLPLDKDRFVPAQEVMIKLTPEAALAAVDRLIRPPKGEAG